MMWIFDPEIANIRKTYKIRIRFLKVKGHAALEKRTGRIVRNQAPEKFPLPSNEIPSVDVEYTDNRARLKTERMAVDCFTILNPRNGCKLLVVSGENKGTVVRHVKTTREKVLVRSLEGGKSFELPKSTVCPVDDS